MRLTVQLKFINFKFVEASVSAIGTDSFSCELAN